MVVFARGWSTKQVVPALNRPWVASVLLSEVHLQQALILAATGHANKKDMMAEPAGWTTRVPGPSRAVCDAEYGIGAFLLSQLI